MTVSLYFGAKIDRATLLAERVGKIVRAIFLTIVSIFAIGGVAVLVWDAWPNLEKILDIGYWKLASRGKLLFSFSLILDLYLVARVIRSGEGREMVGKVKKVRIDVSRALALEVSHRIREAYQLAARLKHAEVEPAHLVAALLGSQQVAALLTRLEIDLKGLQERLQHLLQGVKRGETVFGEVAKKILVAAYQAAQSAKSEYIGAHYVFDHAIRADEKLQEIFFDLGADKEKLQNAVQWLTINEELRHRWRHFRGASSRRPKGEMNRAMTALQTRMLDRFSDDLTLYAGRGYLELVVNCEKEFEEIFRVLQGERKSVLLVGLNGVGKEAILHGIAERMIEEQVPKVLRDRRLVALSIPKLIAGATTSQAEERMLGCFSDLGRAGNVVLAIPNVHEASAGRGVGGLDLAEVLATEMSKGYFLAIATTTPEEYRERIEGTALGHAFTKIEISEPDKNTTIQILESKVGAIEYQTKVYFSYSALEKAVTLSKRYLKDQVLPEKAIEIAKEVAQHVSGKRGEKALVRGEDVAEIISVKSHVPVTSVTATEAQKLLNLEKIMHERLIGQDDAVKAVAAALRRARAEIREQKRPIANFLFLGPTGVGKTETAKTVAEVYFGSEEKMVRLDMSEYQDKSAIYRLLGAPGERGGLLTEPVRKNPFALILLDELEKAHPDILNVFLQVLDDGRATDSAGRVVDFTNTIIIGTSNAGTGFIQESLKHESMKTLKQDEVMAQIKQDLMERELKQYFKPEFLNRFDAIVVFKPLTQDEIFQVAKLILAKVAKQLETKGVMFRATDEAVAELAAAGFDPQFGARPLRRVIQERVQDALANLLLTAKLGRRDVVVLEKGGQLRVEKAKQL